MTIFEGADTKVCKNCGMPIGFARLKANPDAEICAKCIMDARDKEYDCTFDEIEVLEVPEEIKQKLRNRTAKLNREKENWDKEKKQNQIKFQEEFIREKEELLGKQRQVEQKNSELLSRLENITKELNTCVLNNDLTRLQENQIIMYINPIRHTQKSPLLVGKAFVEKNIYDLSIWANVSDKGQRYWSGYLNDPNGYIDGKSCNRRIWFNKKNGKSTLRGRISFGFVDYNVEFCLYEYPLTQFKYWKGKIWHISQEQMETILPGGAQ